MTDANATSYPRASAAMTCAHEVRDFALDLRSRRAVALLPARVALGLTRASERLVLWMEAQHATALRGRALLSERTASTMCRKVRGPRVVRQDAQSHTHPVGTACGTGRGIDLEGVLREHAFASGWRLHLDVRFDVRAFEQVDPIGGSIGCVAVHLGLRRLANSGAGYPSWSCSHWPQTHRPTTRGRRWHRQRCLQTRRCG